MTAVFSPLLRVFLSTVPILNGPSKEYRRHSEEGSGAVTYSSQQTLRLLDGAVTAKEANHHHDGTNTDQDVDT